jgi:ABC-type metal ion transport system, permease component
MWRYHVVVLLKGGRMQSFIANYGSILGQGTLATLYMTLAAAAIAYLFGLPIGVALVVTEDQGVRPMPRFNAVLGAIVNVVRSVPFIILLIAVIPFTRLVVGTSIGSTASIVPLALGAIPFIARMVESSLKELDSGAVEAAKSMGASIRQIVLRVMLPECLPSLILGATITVITLVGYSAMAGTVGGGGLGDIAIRYGYYRYQNDLMVVTILLLVLIVQGVQSLGNLLSRKADRKI